MTHDDAVVAYVAALESALRATEGVRAAVESLGPRSLPVVAARDRQARALDRVSNALPAYREWERTAHLSATADLHPQEAPGVPSTI